MTVPPGAPPSQLPLPLPVETSLEREDFFVSPSNRAAFDAVEAWPDWPGGMLAITGPEGSGKTHLAAIHARAASRLGLAVLSHPAAAEVASGAAAIVEDADRAMGDRAAEERLFHLFNAVAAQGATLLMTGRAPIAGWAATLPDLRSRLATVRAVTLAPPDDALLKAALLKLLADRQIAGEAAADLIGFLVPRMTRSMAAARDLVERLDAASLAGKRRVGRALAAETLVEMESERQGRLSLD